MYTRSHTNVCKFFNFQLTFSQLILHLKWWNFAGLLKVKVFFLVLVYVFEFWIFGHHFGEGSIINADGCFSNPDINSLTDTNSSRSKTARSQDPLYMFKWNKITGYDFLNKITLSHSCRTLPIRNGMMQFSNIVQACPKIEDLTLFLISLIYSL